MRSLVLIRDLRRQLPLDRPSGPAAAAASEAACAGTPSSSSSSSSSALAIDPVHGTGYVLLGAKGLLLACDPEEGGAVVWAADLDAAVDEDEDYGDGTEAAAGAAEGAAIAEQQRPRHEWLAVFHLAEREAVLCVARQGALVLVDCHSGEASLVGLIGPGGVLAASLAPDEELLVFVTGAGVLLGMTPALEVLYETPLARPLAQQPSSAAALPRPPPPVGLSWCGDGKYLAVLAAEQEEPQQPVLRVYDREAGLAFHGKGRRAEDDGAVDGLVQGALAWSTDGALIATARTGVKKGQGRCSGSALEVAFFERNGLRHREFTLREEEGEEDSNVLVAALAWDAEASVLAVLLLPSHKSTSLATPPPPRVQLWHRSNYHWYLKQEVRFPSSSHIVALRFDAERPRRLHCCALPSSSSSSAAPLLEWRTLDFAWDALLSPSPLRTAAVVDGRRCLLTPLAHSLVPPPMAAATVETHRKHGPIVAVGFTAYAAPPLRYRPKQQEQQEQQEEKGAPPAPCVMALLTSAGRVELYDERAAVAGGAAASSLLGCVDVGMDSVECRQVAVLVEAEGQGVPRLRLLLAAWHAGKGVEGVVEVMGVTVPSVPAKEGGGGGEQTPAPLPVGSRRFLPLPPLAGKSSSGTSGGGVLRLQPWGQRRDAALLALEDGRILQYTTEEGTALADPCPQLPQLLEPCPWVGLLDSPNPTTHPPIVIGLSERGRLYANEHCLAPGDCGSFLLHPTFGVLLYATLGSRPHLRMLPYRVLRALDAQAGAEETLLKLGESALESRALERGARLVAAAPSAAAVVLQMPRGNLEAVYPRPLVLHAAARMLDAGRYGQALALLRRQHGDLNFLVDYDPARFEKEGCRLLVEQALLRTQTHAAVGKKEESTCTSSSSMERDSRLAVFLAALNGRDSLLVGNGGGRDGCLETHGPGPVVGGQGEGEGEELVDADAAAPTAVAAAAAAGGGGGAAPALAPAWFPEGKRNRVCALVRAVLLEGHTHHQDDNGNNGGPQQLLAALILDSSPSPSSSSSTEQEQEQPPPTPLPAPLLEPLLTTLARQDPPHFSAALRVIRHETVTTRGEKLSGERAGRLLRYLGFFAPEAEGGVDALYDVALGMYDFGMARAVARLSPRRDPREYLPLLERWAGLRPSWRAKVEVALLLKRPAAALRHMAEAAGGEGEVGVGEVVGIATAHALEEAALALFAPGRFPAVRAALLGKVAAKRAEAGEFRGAMAAYLALATMGVESGEEEGTKPPLLCAAECAKAAGEWATALALLGRLGEGQGMVQAWVREWMVSANGEAVMLGGGNMLLGKEGERRRARWAEAARLGLECCGDVEGAVALLLKARAWGEALRVAYGRGRANVVDGLIKPAVCEAADELGWERLPRWREGYEEGVGRLAALLPKVKEEDEAAAAAAAAAEEEETREGGSLFSVATHESVGSAASFRSTGSVSSNASRHSRLTWATEAAVSSVSSGGMMRTVGETRQARRAKYKAAKRAKSKPPTARETEAALRREVKGLVPSVAMAQEAGALVEALLALGEGRRARMVLREMQALVAVVAAQPLPPLIPPPPFGEGGVLQQGKEEEEEEGGAVGVEAVLGKALLGRFLFLLGSGGGAEAEAEEGEEEEAA